MQNRWVRWLATPTPTPAPVSFLGIEAPVWTIITGITAVVAAGVSIWVAFYSLKRVDRREHHRWLQEKRREAYVTFMTAVRSAYDAISERGQVVGAPRIDSDYSGPETSELREARASIDRKLSEVARAQDVVAIVGPEEMERLGLQVIARLKLDRGYYSPTGWSDRNKSKDKESILRNAEATGNEAFLAALKAAYAKGPVDVTAFRAAFSGNRLDSLWNAFNEKARSVLKESKPGQHR